MHWCAFKAFTFTKNLCLVHYKNLGSSKAAVKPENKRGYRHTIAHTKYRLKNLKHQDSKLIKDDKHAYNDLTEY